MWKKLVDDNKKEDIYKEQKSRKIKLYADEDIEKELIEYLREKKINIKSAKELNYEGRPDSFHVAYAFKNKRFLLTKNVNHFWDDKKVPFQKVFGIIALVGKISDINIPILLALIAFEDYYKGMKIKLSQNELVFKFINNKNESTVTHHKINNTGNIYVWVP